MCLCKVIVTHAINIYYLLDNVALYKTIASLHHFGGNFDNLLKLYYNVNRIKFFSNFKTF